MTLPPAPTFDSETGVRISNEKQKIHPESPEHFIYLMQRLRIGNSECLTFFDSRANAHLIDRNLAKNENLQRISETQSALGVFRGGSIISEFGNFRYITNITTFLTSAYIFGFQIWVTHPSFLNLLPPVQRTKIKKFWAHANLVLMNPQRTQKLQVCRRIPWFWRRSRHSMRWCFCITSGVLVFSYLNLVRGFTYFLDSNPYRFFRCRIRTWVFICVTFYYTYLLEAIKGFYPTWFLKSNPATIISLTQRSCSVGRSRIKLLNVLRESKHDSNSVLSM